MCGGVLVGDEMGNLSNRKSGKHAYVYISFNIVRIDCEGWIS